jgi:predicted anti-sigma-YlaC factor YlaD
MEQLSHRCERARTWASLRADGELSELEDALLDDHLASCADCAGFARGFAGVAGALRASDLIRPAAMELELPRRRRVRTLLPLSLAALVVLAAALAALLLAPARHQATAKPVAMVAAVESPDGLRELRRPHLIDRRNRNAFGDSV